MLSSGALGTMENWPRLLVMAVTVTKSAAIIVYHNTKPLKVGIYHNLWMCVKLHPVFNNVYYVLYAASVCVWFS